MATPTLDEIDKVVFAKDRANMMIDYVESIMLDDIQLEGDRYRVRFSKKSEWGEKDGQ